MKGDFTRATFKPENTITVFLSSKAALTWMRTGTNKGWITTHRIETRNGRRGRSMWRAVGDPVFARVHVSGPPKPLREYVIGRADDVTQPDFDRRYTTPAAVGNAKPGQLRLCSAHKRSLVFRRGCRPHKPRPALMLRFVPPEAGVTGKRIATGRATWIRPRRPFRSRYGVS